MLTYECGDVRDGEATVQGKQAKIVSPTQERAILGYLETTRYPHRDRVMFLLSMKAGLRAKEMAALTWAMVTDAAGQIAEAIHLQNRASKGKTGGRTIPMHPDLQDALTALQTARGDAPRPEQAVLFSERGGGLSPATVRLWFHRLYRLPLRIGEIFYASVTGPAAERGHTSAEPSIVLPGLGRPSSQSDIAIERSLRDT